MDLNVQAYRLVQKAVEEVPTPKVAKRKAARSGGIKGGKARAAALSSDRRQEIAILASNARWKKVIL
jgi:hypothetical protein